jgi:hypothetical protein
MLSAESGSRIIFVIAVIYYKWLARKYLKITFSVQETFAASARDAKRANSTSCCMCHLDTQGLRNFTAELTGRNMAELRALFVCF